MPEPEYDDDAPDEEGSGTPVHPLFAEAEEAAAAAGRPPLAAPIEVIDVCKYTTPNTTQKPAYLANHPASELVDESTVLELYGPGFYMLVGRNANRSRILRRAQIRVGIFGNGAPAHGHQPPPAAPTSSGETTANAIVALLVSEMRAGRESTSQMMMTFAQASRDGANDLVKAVSSLAGSRIADQQALIQALTASKGAEQSNASAMEKGAELYEKTLANAIALREELIKSGGGDSENNALALVNAFVGGVQTLRQDPNSPGYIAAHAAAREAAEREAAKQTGGGHN